MANEMPNRAEEMLRRYAEQRRRQAGAPFEMHPATRRMLQSEVERQYRPSGQAGQHPSWLESLLFFSPRLGWIVSLFLVLGFVGFLLVKETWTGGPKVDFAKNLATSQPPAAVPSLAPGAVVDQRPSRGRQAANAVNPPELAASGAAPTIQPAPPTAPIAVEAAAPPPPVVVRAAPPTPQPVMRSANADRSALREGEPAMDRAAVAAGLAKRAGGEGQGITEYYDAVRSQTAPAPGATEAEAIRAAPLAGMAASGWRRDAGPPAALERKAALAKEAVEAKAEAAAPKQILAKSAFNQQANADTETAVSAPAPATAAPPPSRQSFAIVSAPIAEARRLAESQREPEPVIMGVFDLEQIGDRIRIIDADGSVYEGKVEGAATVDGNLKFEANGRFRTAGKPLADKLSREAPDGVVEKAKADVSAKPISFTASGVSRKLGQPVTISGALLAAGEGRTDDSQPAAAFSVPAPRRESEIRGMARSAYGGGAGSKTVARETAPPAADHPGDAAPLAIRITGFVRVGSGPERPINAVRVEK